LESICDTFAPGGNGLPAASQLGVPDALLALVERNPHASEHKQFLSLLGLWDSRLNSLWSGGLLRRFSSARQDVREKILLSWWDSRFDFERAAFQVLKRASLLLYYMLPGRDGGANPAWKSLSYPGPLGAPKNPSPRKINPLHIERDTNLVCDVCVIGSGAGGG